ncbi:MAG: competence protein ComEC [Bacteroidia bacterium]|jgi:competence protein ComEC
MSFFLLREAPFVRLVVPVLAGILLCHGVDFWDDRLIVVGVFLLGLIGSYLFLLNTVQKYRFVSWNSMVIHLLLFAISYTTTHLHTNSNGNNYVKASNDNQLVVRLTEAPILKGRYYKSKAKVLFQDTAQRQGLILVYLEISEKPPVYGDEIVFQASLHKVKPPQNPYEFNYQKYLLAQRIEFQSFVPYKSWYVVNEKTGHWLFQFGYEIRGYVLDQLAYYFPSDTHQAILKALLVGDKSGLDADLKRGFSETGTMHVMAVSGLHVGIVFLFTKAFFGLFFRSRFKYLRTLLSLLTLWFFALITGFSPSVSRACFMFSIMAIGIEINRSTSVYNSIACAAFCLLLFNPLSLLNVGFQFSFLAVIGIVTLQKPLRNLVSISSSIWGKVADLTAVSVAAQLATLPLALYYFGQFPTLFFISNLIIIPAITILLYAGLILIIVSKIGVVAVVVAYIMEAYLWFILQTVEVIQTVPYAFLQDIHIRDIDFIIILACVISLSYCILRPKRALGWMFFLIAVIGFTTSQSTRIHKNRNTSELVVFDLGKETYAVLRDGNRIHPLDKKDISENDWNFRCKPYLVAHHVSNTTYKSMRLEEPNAPVTKLRIETKNSSKSIFLDRLIELHGVSTKQAEATIQMKNTLIHQSKFAVIEL